MRSRSESLEFALLGLLSQSPLHGYELRKRMSAIFGPFRALSFSVLYPQLRRMMEAVGFPVLDLTRKSFGPMRLGNLKPGQFRELSKLEVSMLMEAATGKEVARKRR